MVQQQHRLEVDGRVVVAERQGKNWFVYIEDDPANCSFGGFDRLVVAELLGHGANPDAYPDPFDAWAEEVEAAR